MHCRHKAPSRTSCPTCVTKDIPLLTTRTETSLGKYVYYALVRDNEDYSLVEIRAQFRTEDKSLSELYQIANDLNLNKYLCKCSAYRNDDGDNICSISMEFITSSASMTNYQMGYILQLIPECVDDLLNEL